MTQPAVVLVHGLGGSAAAWNRVVPLLANLGLPNVAIDLPSCGPVSEVDDADALRSVLDGCDDQVVLVGHSAGGMVVTEVGNHPSVKHLVYVEAAMPDVGESLFTLQADGFPEGFVKCLRQEGDVSVWDADALTRYLLSRGWTSDDVQDFVLTSRPQRFAPLVATATVAAWRSVPSTFISCTDSEMNGNLRQFFGSRATDVFEMPGDHFPIWVHSEEVTDVIARIARKVSTS
jgi:pimeloyl-ACP methyl ester carboxylesterase